MALTPKIALPSLDRNLIVHFCCKIYNMIQQYFFLFQKSNNLSLFTMKAHAFYKKKSNGTKFIHG